MNAIFAEMPLALFSTLAPMGAGAFVILSMAFATARFDNAALKKIDKFTTIPVAFVIVGFIAAFFHLANPLHALGTLSNLGVSPLSNEVAIGVAFTVIMLVYWIWALSGKMSEGVRKGFSVVVAIAGVVFAFFTGMAYMINTIPSWDIVAGPVQVAGFALVGGAALGVLVLALSGCTEQLKSSSLKISVIIVLIIGLVMGIGGLAAQAMATSTLGNAMYSGADLVANAMMTIVCGAICLIATGACDLFAVRGSGASAAVGVSACAAAFAIVGILMLRLAFYAMQISVGISVL